jgi:hypothetical protein
MIPIERYRWKKQGKKCRLLKKIKNGMPIGVGIVFFEAPHNSALRNMLGKVPSDYYTK